MKNIILIGAGSHSNSCRFIESTNFHKIKFLVDKKKQYKNYKVILEKEFNNQNLKNKKY